MKTKILPLVVVILFALGACTEYIEVEKIVTIRDTVTIGKTTTYKDRRFLGLDTTSIPVTIPFGPGDPDGPMRDSIIYVDRIDSVFVERIVYVTKTVVEHDTIVVREYSYGDTLFVTYGRSIQLVPEELWPMFLEFFSEARKHGYSAGTGGIEVIISNFDDILPAYSYYAYGQVFIRINGNLTFDSMMIPLYRELARQRLGKEYSQSPDSPMNPFYPSSKIRWSNRVNFKAEIDQIFE